MVHLLDEISSVYSFWKLARIFLNHTFFSEKKLFWAFWEFLSNNKSGDAFFKTSAGVSDFRKQSRFFSEKKPSSFPIFKNIQNLNIFQIFYTLIPFETHSSKELLGIAILKRTTYFLEKTHLIFQNSTNFWTFSNFWSNSIFWNAF